jgi:hypothetical protein
LPDDGQITSISRSKLIQVCPAPCAKISLFRFSENRDLILSVPLRHEGRTRRHERGAECGGRECADRRTARLRTAMSCGPGAPMQALSPSKAESFAKATVANAGSPGRTRISRKPSRREGRCDHRLYLWFSRSRKFPLREAPGAAATRPSLRPQHFSRAIYHAKLGRNASREHEGVAAA